MKLQLGGGRIYQNLKIRCSAYQIKKYFFLTNICSLLKVNVVVFFPQFHHFHFSPFTFQHIVGRSQFSALCHSDLREHLVSHTGEKPLRCTTSLESHELFLIFSFWFSRYRGLHWGWGGSARGGGGRRWMRGKATQIQLVFPSFSDFLRGWAKLLLVGS